MSIFEQIDTKIFAGTTALTATGTALDTNVINTVPITMADRTVIGPLTDTELRAAAVPISMVNRNVYLFDSAGTAIVLEGGRVPVANIVVDSADPTRAQEFDTLFRVPYTMDVAHHEVHEKDAYEASIYDEDAALGHVIQFLFTTPATATPQKRMHMTMEHEGTGEHQFRVTEGVTYTAGGAVFVPVNKFREAVPHTSASTNFRVGSNKAGNVITYTGGLTPPMRDSWGGQGKSIGNSDRGTLEWVLAPSTTYIFELFSRAAGILIELSLEWYEHTDSN